MSIGVDLTNLKGFQGIEVFTAELLRAWISLPSRSEKLYVICFTPMLEQLGFLNQYGNIEYIKINFDPGSKFKRLVATQILVPYYALKYHLSQLYSPNVFSPLFYFGQKVVTIHDCAYDRFSEARSWFADLYIKLNYWLAKYFASTIVTVSLFSRDELLKFYKIPLKKIKVISGALPSLPAVEDEMVVGIQNKFGLYGFPYLIFIGNIRPRKNIQNILLAFKMFVDKHSNYKLVLVGKSDDSLFRLFDEISRLHLSEQVVCTGFVSQVEKITLLLHSTVMVFPSLYEGFGLPVLEAQSVGVPVLTANSSSLPEVAGNGAFFVDPYNVVEIGEGIDRVVGDYNLRVDLIKKGKENFKRFTWEKSAEELDNIFTNI